MGLTVGVGALAIAYGLRAGREHARAYFGLMLVLVGATVGVFAAQDLLLFYVFFELMLIPLYVLIGVWGGANSRAATIKFVIYTMVGSLLMLVSIVALGLSQGTFDLTQMGTSGSVAMFLGFAIAFGIKAPLWPFHGWLPDAYRESSAGGRRDPLGRHLEDGGLRLPPDRATDLSRSPWTTMRDTILVLASRSGSSTARCSPSGPPTSAASIAYSSLAQMCLILIGLFAVNDSGARRRAAPDGQPRPHLGGPVPARGLRRAPHRRPASSRCSAAWRAGDRSSRRS